MSMLVGPKQVVVVDLEEGIFTAKIDQISERSFPSKNLHLKRTLKRSADFNEVMAAALGYCAGVRKMRNGGIVKIEYSRRLEDHFAGDEIFQLAATESKEYHYLFPEDAQEESETSLIH